MNRRSFLSILSRSVAAVAVAPTILPAATTYVRQWRKQGTVIVPYWIQTTRAIRFTTPEYEAAIQKLFVESFFFNKPMPIGDTARELRIMETIAPPDPFASFVNQLPDYWKEMSNADYLKRLEGTWT